MSKGDVGGLPCVINGQEQLVFVPGFVDINYLNIPDKNASDHFYETIMDCDEAYMEWLTNLNMKDTGKIEDFD